MRASAQRTTAPRCWQWHTLVLLLLLLGCNSGGGGIATVPSAAWPRFRHDTGHTGQGPGDVASARATPMAIPVDADAPRSPVLASPAIGIEGNVFVASQAGTLLSVGPNGEARWRLTECAACPAGDATFGPIVSSPTLYAVPNQVPTLFFGSESGRFYAVEDRREGPVCTMCFDPRRNGEAAAARFSAPALVLIHSVTTRPVQIIAPAAMRASEGGAEVGRVWSLSSTGEVLWRYPPTGTWPAPFVSSPALAVANSVVVGSSDGFLHLLDAAQGGLLRWRLLVGPIVDPDTPVALVPVVTSSAFFMNTADGNVSAISPDGSGISWQRAFADTRFAASLALGVQAPPTVTFTPTPPPASATPTPTPTEAALPTTPGTQATPTPSATATASATPTPLSLNSVLFAISKDGRLLALAARDGRDAPLGDVQQVVEGEVLSSPALSQDGYLVFGTTKGLLYAIDNTSGLAAWPPISLTSAPVRSSPAIGFDGSIWVGADDGVLYRIGSQ